MNGGIIVETLTASRFKQIVSMRKESTIRNFLAEISNLSPRVLNIPACQYGLDNEHNAKTVYELYYRKQKRYITISPSGLCVSNEFPWLECTPDGIVTDGSGKYWLLEIKCVYDSGTLPKTLQEIYEERKKHFYCYVDIDGKFNLRETHNYFYQVTGQMAITGLHSLDFAIFLPRTGEIYVIPMEFNKTAWKLIFSRLNRDRKSVV